MLPKRDVTVGVAVTTVIVILAIWTLLSLPLSVLLGVCLKDTEPPELLGMDGADALMRGADGVVRRVSLLASAPT